MYFPGISSRACVNEYETRIRIILAHSRLEEELETLSLWQEKAAQESKGKTAESYYSELKQTKEFLETIRKFREEL